jgi:integrase
MDALAAAQNASRPIEIGASRTQPGTVAHAVARYLGSTAFEELAPSTRAMRHAILERFRTEHGDKRIRKLQAEHVARLLQKLRPYAQRNMLKTLRGLMAFAAAPEQQLIDVDPTAGVKLTKVKDTGGFETWTETDIEAYRKHHALGSRSRLALELLYGTMAARADVVRLGAQHVKNGLVEFRRQKTNVEVTIPILPELQEAIDAMPRAEHLTYLMTEFGKPFTAAGFGNWFRDQCDDAGISLSAHGLRKAGATRLAEHGCTDHEIMAWGGWTSLKEVQRYTKAANRKRLALQASERLKAGTKVSNLPTQSVKPSKKS